jgi:WD40 repeat protein
MGKRVGVTAVSFDPSGRFMACGTACGSIQIWKTDRVGTRPDRAVYNAHGENIAVHSLKFNFDGKRLASRCMEGDSVRVWDARRLSRSSLPMVECLNLLSLYEYSNCAFSPNGQLLCAGTSVKPLSKRKMGDKSEQRKEHGKVKFYRVGGQGHDKQQPIWEMDIAMQKSVVNVFWHAKLNQIFLGISDGSVRILYDTKLSKKGALLCVAKGMRKVDDLSLLLESRAPTGSAGVTGDIITPNALPLFRSEAENKKRKRDMGEEEDYRRPEPPATGIKVGEGTSAGLNFQQHVLDSRIKNRNIAGKDPRDDLFKYTTGKNYTREEHKPILAEKTVEEEEEEENE